MKEFARGASALLAGVMVIAFSPTSALATTGPKSPGDVDSDGEQTGGATITLAGHTIYDKNVYKSSLPNIDGYAGATYDEASNTLTLTNVVESKALEATNVGDDFKIDAEGVNSLGSIVVEDSSVQGESYSSAVEFTGAGSLIVNQEGEYDNAVTVYGDNSSANAGCVVVDKGASVKFCNDSSERDAYRVKGSDAYSVNGHGAISIVGTGIDSALGAIRIKGLATQPEVTIDNQESSHIYASAGYSYDASQTTTPDYTFTENGVKWAAFHSNTSGNAKYYTAYRVYPAPTGQQFEAIARNYIWSLSESTLQAKGAVENTAEFATVNTYFNSTPVYQNGDGKYYGIVLSYDGSSGESVGKVYELQGLQDQEVSKSSSSTWTADVAIFKETVQWLDGDWDSYIYPGYTRLAIPYTVDYYNYDVNAEAVEQGTVTAPTTQADYTGVKAQLDAANENLAAVQAQVDSDASALASAQAAVTAVEKELAKYAKTISVNVKTITTSTVSATTAKNVKTLTLGTKVSKVKSGALANFTRLKTLVVKSTKLAKKSVKGALKGSGVKKLVVKVPGKKLKAYKKVFTAKNLGVKKVTVKKA